ncbi:hypothetical protein ACFV3R_00455 [Streptomyces sp. NPDC059740]|uniref:hypothetical protein n=1 Tax=Streptomyces sp. NPDC059740 TaxID=3346926 RepID=UPI00365CFCC7
MTDSSGGTVRVDTEMLQSAARKLEDLTEYMKNIAENFKADCDAFGDVIGDDKNGKQMHGQYDKSHTDALTAGFDGASLLQRTTDEVNQLVRSLHNVEQTATEVGQRLNSHTTNG